MQPVHGNNPRPEIGEVRKITLTECELVACAFRYNHFLVTEEVAVSYTRVSSKEQADKNMSLVTPKGMPSISTANAGRFR